MVQGENYGTIGGWTKPDFILEWIKRQVLGAPKRVDFTFNEETFSLERKGRRKASKSKSSEFQHPALPQAGTF
jgi:hypothetical protein